MQFLMGPNESYSAIRGQILLVNPLPDFTKAYSSIMKEEKQRSLRATHEMTETLATAIRREEPVALAARRGQGSSSHSTSSNRKPLHYSYVIEITMCETHVGSWTDICQDIRNTQLSKSNQEGIHSKHNNGHQSSVNEVKEGSMMQEMESITNGLSDLRI